MVINSKGYIMGIQQDVVRQRNILGYICAVLIGLSIGNLIAPVHVLAVPDPNALKTQGPDTIGNPQQITVIGQLNPNSLQTPVNPSGTGAASTITLTMNAVANVRNYCSGFEITGAGATAASVIVVTLATLQGGVTFSYDIVVPAGLTTSITPLIVEFNPAIAATAVNTAITLTVPSFGAGNTNSAAVLHGWRE